MLFENYRLFYISSVVKKNVGLLLTLAGYAVGSTSSMKVASSIVKYT